MLEGQGRKLVVGLVVVSLGQEDPVPLEPCPGPVTQLAAEAGDHNLGTSEQF